MTTKIYGWIIVLLWVHLSACKKSIETSNMTSDQTEKTNFYKNKGFQYLFSIDRGEADSLSPIFFGKTSNNDYKCLYSRIKNGSSQNIASIYNNGIREWSLPGLNLSGISKDDYYSLDAQDFLKFSSRYYNWRYFYNEEDGNSPTTNYTTEFDGKSGIGDSFYTTMASSNILKRMHHLYYTHGNNRIVDSFIYYAAIFGYNKNSYLIYYKSTNLEIDNFETNCKIMVSNKSGAIFNRRNQTRCYQRYFLRIPTMMNGVNRKS